MATDYETVARAAEALPPQVEMPPPDEPSTAGQINGPVIIQEDGVIRELHSGRVLLAPRRPPESGSEEEQRSEREVDLVLGVLALTAAGTALVLIGIMAAPLMASLRIALCGVVLLALGERLWIEVRALARRSTEGEGAVYDQGTDALYHQPQPRADESE